MAVHSLVVLLICSLALPATLAMKDPMAHEDDDVISRSRRASPGAQAQTPFSFEDIFDAALRPRGHDGNWARGPSAPDQFTFRDNVYRNLMLYNAVNDQQTLLMPNTTFTQVGTGTYYVSPDLGYVLLAYEIESLWRYSYSAKYKIYNVATRALTDFPAAPLAATPLQFAGWSSGGHALSFVYENNLYVQETPTSASFLQLTNDGDATYIFNGVADWLYEEDVLGDYQTHYWSPDSSSLCYATFNDANVPLMSWPVYGNKELIYPEMKEIAYPKPGNLVDADTVGANPEVTLTCITDVFNYPTSSKVVIAPPAEFQSVQHYYTSLTWKDNSNILVAWTNRVQNHIIVNLCHADTAACSKNYERSLTTGWVQAPWPSPVYINDGTHYVTYLPKPEGNDFFNHIAYVTVEDGITNDITYLTSGQDEIVYIAGFDSTRNLVYYVATNGNPTERHLFRVGTPEAADADRPATCLTCADETCKVTSATFSSSATYYFYRCQGPGIYTYWLRDTATKNVPLELNADVEARMAQKAMPRRVYSDIIMDGGYVAKAEYYLPPGYVQGNKYPLFVYAYGGPDSQQVIKTYDAGSTRKNWLRYLGSTENIVVASIDGRGSSYQGENHRFSMYHRLGVVEIADHLEGGRHFKSQSYIDSTKNAAIFGWSYGGFTTAHALADQSNVYQCGMSVAPVTSYRYYDTAYTERYMGLATTSDNAAGYDATDLMSKASQFAGKHFLLVHGTADDNVHFQHSAQLVNSLTEAEVQFKLMMYVDENHGIPYSSRHLYRLMTDSLLDDCWTSQTAVYNHAPRLAIANPLWLACVAMLVTLLIAAV